MRLSIRPPRMAPAMAAALAAAALAPALARAAPFVPPPLAQAAAAAQSPRTKFDTIVLGAPGATTDGVVASIRAVHGVARQAFQSIPAAEAWLTGPELLALAADPTLRSITPNGAVRRQSVISGRLWPQAADVAPLWSGTPGQGPAIAIVDSGVDARNSPDFGARVVAALDFTGEKHARSPTSSATGRSSPASPPAPRSRRWAQHPPRRSSRCASSTPTAPPRSPTSSPPATGSTRTASPTTSASRTSRWRAPSPTTRWTTRSTPRSTGSGSTAWSWSRRRGTPATGGCCTRPPPTRSRSPSARPTSPTRSTAPTTAPPRGRRTARRPRASRSPSSARPDGG